MTRTERDITQLLSRLQDGDNQAHSELMDAVYEDLRGLAEHHLRRQFGRRDAGLTLQPTAIVNETYLKLIRQRKAIVSGEHFFALATRIMIRVLLDYYRRRQAEKRGGNVAHVAISMDDAVAGESTSFPEVVEAIEGLEKLDARKGHVVQLRVFWGLSHPQIAELLDVGVATVDRDWRFAKSWLKKELGEAV